MAKFNIHRPTEGNLPWNDQILYKFCFGNNLREQNIHQIQDLAIIVVLIVQNYSFKYKNTIYINFK